MANRTQVAGRLASLPAPIVTAVTPGYNGPNVPISYEQANGFQEAICRPLEDGNVVLDKDNYDQFRDLLSGVHAIKSNIRSDVETTGVTTVATSAAVACETTICSGSRSFAGGGSSNTNSGARSASSGGSSNTNSGSNSASSGGNNNTNSGINSSSSGGGGNTNSGTSSASSGGGSNTNSGNFSSSSGGIASTNSGDFSASLGSDNSYNSGDNAVNCASRYAENIDDYCAFGGYAAAAPANHGDGLTNKNIKWKLHNDTGNAEFEGDVKFGGNVDDGTGATVIVDASTGLVSQLDYDDTGTGTITTAGGNSIAITAQPAYTTYNDEATIVVEVTLTPAAGSQVIKHGDYFDLDLPNALHPLGDYQHTWVQVSEKRVTQTNVFWSSYVRLAGSARVRVFNAGPDTTLDASTYDVVMVISIHRIPTT